MHSLTTRDISVCAHDADLRRGEVDNMRHSMRYATALAVAVTAFVLAVPSAQAAVGRTTGQAGVSAGGTSGYSVPIFAPPGTNGMTPSTHLTAGS